MGQTTDLQTTAIEFIQAAESLLMSGDFAEAESAVNACLMLLPGDKRALSLLERIKRKDALDVVSETSTILDSILSEIQVGFAGDESPVINFQWDVVKGLTNFNYGSIYFKSLIDVSYVIYNCFLFNWK